MVTKTRTRPLLSLIRLDYRAYNLSSKRLILACVSLSPFWLVMLYRVSHWLLTYHLSVPAAMLFGLGKLIYAAEISPGAECGAPLRFVHPVGIVLGAGVVLGDNCEIFQHVTFGGHDKSQGAATIGDNVTIFAGAVLLGPVKIGSGSAIGANSVVINDVPALTTVFGIPAKPVARVEVPHALRSLPASFKSH